MDSMLQMQNEVMQLTEQLFMAENKAKELGEDNKRMGLELAKCQQKAHQLHKEKNAVVRDRDRQMRDIQQSLMMFEASLRSEQKRIAKLLDERNCLIDRQRKEIHMYRSIIINKAKSDRLVRNSRITSNSRVSKVNGKTVLASVQEAEFSNELDYDSDVSPKTDDESNVSPDSKDYAEETTTGKIGCLEGNHLVKMNKIILNHRSVIKPKDIKNKRINKERSKTIDVCESDGPRNANVQYWTPYI